MAYGEDELISLPFRWVVYTVASLPLAALILCVSCALVLHFPEATATHCGVPNWLPSVSAAVSTFTPEKYIWRVLIGIHGGPRFILAYAYRNFLLSSPLQPLNNTCIFRALCQFACGVHVVENISLLLLTAISSTENHVLHAVSFGVFAISSLIYMMLSTYLYSYSGRRRAFSTKIGEASFEYKALAASISLISMCVAGYLYYRHNAYCEPGVYTLFAMAEYMIILSNIAFHCTLYLDFHGKSLTLGSSMGYQYQLLPSHHHVDKNT